MSPAKSHPPRKSRQPVKPQSLRDLTEAFGRYYDKVERDSAGRLVATCDRCRIVSLVAWPDDPDYVRGCLEFAHENHRHR